MYFVNEYYRDRVKGSLQTTCTATSTHATTNSACIHGETDQGQVPHINIAKRQMHGGLLLIYYNASINDRKSTTICCSISYQSTKSQTASSTSAEVATVDSKSVDSKSAVHSDDCYIGAQWNDQVVKNKNNRCTL